MIIFMQIIVVCFLIMVNWFLYEVLRNRGIPTIIQIIIAVTINITIFGILPSELNFINWVL